MPTVINMILNGVDMEDVIGKAHRPHTGIKMGENLDGSSLDIGKLAHLVVFTVGRDLLPRVKPLLNLNSHISFKANYSTGESVDQASVLVRNVTPLDNGDVEYTLSIGPDSGIIDQPSPG